MVCLTLFCFHESGWVVFVERGSFRPPCYRPLLQVQTNMTAVGGSPVFLFNGGQDSYVSFEEDFSFQPSLGFTVSAWVQQDPGNEG